MSSLGDSAWRRLQLPVEKHWSAPGGQFSSIPTQTGVETLLSPFRVSIPGTVGTFQCGGVFFGLRALTIQPLLMSLCGQGCELGSCSSSFQS